MLGREDGLVVAHPGSATGSDLATEAPSLERHGRLGPRKPRGKPLDRVDHVPDTMREDV